VISPSRSLGRLADGHSEAHGLALPIRQQEARHLREQAAESREGVVRVVENVNMWIVRTE